MQAHHSPPRDRRPMAGATSAYAPSTAVAPTAAFHAWGESKDASMQRPSAGAGQMQQAAAQPVAPVAAPELQQPQLQAQQAQQAQPLVTITITSPSRRPRHRQQS